MCAYSRAIPLLQELFLIVIYIKVFALDFFQRNSYVTPKFIPEKAIQVVLMPFLRKEYFY